MGERQYTLASCVSCGHGFRPRDMREVTGGFACEGCADALLRKLVAENREYIRRLTR